MCPAVQHLIVTLAPFGGHTGVHHVTVLLFTGRQPLQPLQGILFPCHLNATLPGVLHGRWKVAKTRRIRQGSCQVLHTLHIGSGAGELAACLQAVDPIHLLRQQPPQPLHHTRQGWCCIYAQHCPRQKGQLPHFSQGCRPVQVQIGRPLAPGYLPSCGPHHDEDSWKLQGSQLLLMAHIVFAGQLCP